ncbi:TorD/DmsD family molecular chaperone [Spiribacter halobius]|uniref:Molecular chaperone n=1 Tax=Sediminicurvatus halobius TaxID=2182432 RepID=A0A2U2MZB8_9GAMM|nr:molecular chaperone TorD family protein [Spiribacter halobius]PWG62220.1 hypothetical protein DEM34_13000 [Spiribacter halobius]UEX78128.1 molecular chaperone TorD family protein [Spiribacter halobius]
MTSQATAQDERESMQTDSEEWLRSRVYGLLGRLFADIPPAEVIEPLRALEVDPADGPLAEGWHGLAEAARAAGDEALDIEYHALFIGLGRGEVMPFASWYLTGFLMGRPLVKLRRDLRALGVEREDDVHEPEDHIGALFEAMALLSGPEGGSFAAQREFFNAHLASWVERFMQDLRGAPSARFYKAVGAFGERFMVLEKQYLEMI